MMTLLQSALTGWTDYTQHGKFAALLLAAMVYLGYAILRPETGTGNHRTDDNGTIEKNRLLYVYAVLTALGCICPVTASILMKYQTAFYSYVWIWAAVPQTLLIAWAGAELLDSLRKMGQQKEKRLSAVAAGILLAGIVFLSGNPVSEWARTQTMQIPDITGEENLQRQEASAWETLELLAVYHQAESGTDTFTLWAPKEIMASARAFSAQIRPVYGRSIWDAALGSYSYDTYEPWQENLYLWMSHLESTGETQYKRTDGPAGEAREQILDFTACLDSARSAGVDYILLPGNLSEDALTELQQSPGTEWVPFEGEYYLVVLK